MPYDRNYSSLWFLDGFHVYIKFVNFLNRKVFDILTNKVIKITRTFGVFVARSERFLSSRYGTSLSGRSVVEKNSSKL